MNKALLLAIFAFSFDPRVSSGADESVCVPGAAGDPAAQIEKAAKDVRCAAIDDFTRSCAYRNFILNERAKDAPNIVRTWVESVGRVFDPNAKFDSKESLYRDIQVALADPKFFEIYDYWEELGKPKAQSGSYPENLRNTFGSAELGRFYQAIRALSIVDSSGSLTSTIELLGNLPDGAGSKASLDQKKALLAKVLHDGFEFRNSHSVGCSSFVVSSHELYEGYTKFGPAMGPNDQADKYASEKDKAIAASRAATESKRTLEGATDKLEACGYTSAGVYTFEREIIRSCDVDLPMMVFHDNQAKLAPADEQTLVGAIAKDECYQKAVKSGLKIQKVAIATSANTLHNTANYCKWEFDRLSADRGKSIQAAMSGFFGDQVTQYSVNDKGTTGDGTSGPCAYVAKEKKGSTGSQFEVDDIVDGKKRTRYFTEEPDPKYTTASGKAELEKAKFAKTTIYFEDRTNPIPSGARQWSASTRCKVLRYDCK